MQHLLKLSAILLVLVWSSCGQADQSSASGDSIPAAPAVSSKEVKTSNALVFINAYVENANKMNQALGLVEWVNANALATPQFKDELKKIVDEANKQDPEMGLEADPLFNAQEYPEQGFELESIDEKTNYLVVKGKGMPDFKLTMKMTDVNGKWMVDGCGMINIPADQQAK